MPPFFFSLVDHVAGQQYQELQQRSKKGGWVGSGRW
jgi:hypothetical protein